MTYNKQWKWIDKICYLLSIHGPSEISQITTYLQELEPEYSFKFLKGIVAGTIAVHVKKARVSKFDREMGVDSKRKLPVYKYFLTGEFIPGELSQRETKN
jgi:hypothetical protein